MENNYLLSKLKNQRQDNHRHNLICKIKIYKIKRDSKELNEVMSTVSEEVDDNFLKTTIINLLAKYNLSEIQNKNYFRNNL